MRNAIKKFAPICSKGCALLLLLLTQPVQAEKLTLNLKGADISALIETVSEATGKNFILDPKVQGKVTVVSTRPMDANELYQTFLSILEVHGFIAVPSGKVIKIVPDAALKYRGELASPATDAMPDDDILVQVFSLEHIDAARLIPTLRPLASPKGHMAAHTDGNMLVVSDYASIVKRLGQIIRRVDLPITNEFEMIHLEHASAQELAQLLNNMEKGTGSAQPGGKVNQPVVADERTNSLLIGGDKQTLTRMRAIVAHLDTPVIVSGNTRVVHLRFAKAKEMAEVLISLGENFIKKSKEDKSKPEGIFNVQAYKDSNALVMTAPPSVLRSMEDVIQRLDVRRAQVQVEAIIAEVSTDQAAELGIEWGILGGMNGERGIVTGANFPSGSGHPGLFALGATALGGSPTDKVSAASHLTGMVVGGTDLKNLAVLLRAIKSNTSNNVLSTPTLVTLDNAEAEIIVGKEVPVLTGGYASTGTTPGNSSTIGTPFNTYSRKNVGLTLRVTPQINEGDTIHLELVQEASALEDTASTELTGKQTTNTRSIKTTVLVDNGQILVLGGLISNNVEQSVSKVPLLGDLPVLGVLFRAERKTNKKTNLMVFLRPTILRNPEDALALTNGKYNTIRNQQLATPDSWNPMFRGTQAPLLPKMDEFLRTVPNTSAPPVSTPEAGASNDPLTDSDFGKPVPVNPKPTPHQVSDGKQNPDYAEEEDYVR